MLVTLVTVCSLTAGLASAFTVSLVDLTVETFQSPEDLRGMRIAAVSGTTGVRWANYYQAQLIETLKIRLTVYLVGGGFSLQS